MPLLVKRVPIRITNPKRLQPTSGWLKDPKLYRPTGPVDGVKARGVFVGVVEGAGCAGARTVKLEFLRGVDYDTFLNVSNSIPSCLEL